MAEAKAEQALSDILYDRCTKDALDSPERLKKVFSQDALLTLCSECKDLEHIKDARGLMPMIQTLSSTGLFIVLKSKSGSCWGVRPREAAGKLQGLSQDARTIYTLIEEAHESGIWIRALRGKTGIKDTKYMDKTLTHMVKLGLVQVVTNVKSAGRRYYMLAHLAPSQDMTGGSFYDSGDLDELLIDDLTNLIVFHVRQMSWVDVRKKRVKREVSPILIRDDPVSATEGAQDSSTKEPPKKRKRETTGSSKDIEDLAPPRKHHHRSRRQSHHAETETVHTQVPFAAGHTYPTAKSIHEFIMTSKIFNPVRSTHLTEDEVQRVINVLLWDGKLEEINGGYRTVRGVRSKQIGEQDDPAELLSLQRGDGLSEMPCGRCPVVDLCGTGGPINPETCVYFDTWLGFRKAPEVGVPIESRVAIEGSDDPDGKTVAEARTAIKV